MSYNAFYDGYSYYMIPYSQATFHDGKFYCTEYIANRAVPLSNFFPRLEANEIFDFKTYDAAENKRGYIRWVGIPSDVPSNNGRMKAGYTDLSDGTIHDDAGLYYGRGYNSFNKYYGYCYLAFDMATGATIALYTYNLLEGGKAYNVTTTGQIFVEPDGSDVALVWIGGSVLRAAFALNNNEYNPNLPLFPGPTSGDDEGASPGTEGGGGTYQNPDDPIGITDISGLLGAIDTGLVSIYAPSVAQIQAFASSLWDANLIQQIKNYFNQPLDAVLGLSIVPLSGIAGTAKNVKAGTVDLGVSMYAASKQFVQVSCGSINIKEFFGSCLDYAPYTKISLFLPYIGIVRLNTDDVMNKTITVVYNVDILSGACLAQVKSGNAVLYQYAGNCAINIPLSAISYANTIGSAVSIAATTVGAVAAIATGGLSTAANVGIAGAAVASTASSVMSAKPQIQHSGSIGGAAGMLGGQIPYIIREQPKQSLAKDYNTFVGYPCNITMNLSACKGFTQVEEVHLESMSCTAEEAAEIENLLKGGVII